MLREVNAFDMNDVVNAVIHVVDHEDPPYFVNITGGTNLMAGAATAAAFFIGARAYYVSGKRGSDLAEAHVIELPVPNIPYYRSVDRTQLRVLRALESLGGRAGNPRLKESLGISAQSLSYHIKELVKKGLVSVTRGQEARSDGSTVDNRIVFVEITNAGKLVSSWSS